MIQAIIVDDEPYCVEVLATLLGKYCPEVEVVATCASGAEGISAIRQHRPQLVFLDVEMPHMNGFQMLEALPQVDFDLIFTTSYDQYAIKAIRFSALDYLLKPIDREELQKAVQKAARRSPAPLTQQLELLLQKISQPTTRVNKVAMPTMEGLQMVTVANIISCASDSNYTILQLKDKQKLVVSRTLKEIEELLEEHSFARVHHSYLANLNEVTRYVKGEGGYLVMSDGSHIDVSRSRKESVIKKLQSKE
jgi:two-component system, LytTR family, response regulator